MFLQMDTVISGIFLCFIGLAQAQFRWYRPNDFNPQQLLRQGLPPYLHQQNFNHQPRPDFGFNRRFVGFQAPLFGRGYHASSGVQEQSSNQPVAAQGQQRKVNEDQTRLFPGFASQQFVDPNFQAAINVESPAIRLSDNPVQPKTETEEEKIDACSYVVCPRGTLCATHPSQCNKPTCPQYAACEPIKSIESCSQPLQVGNCSYKYEHYFFNSTSGKCEPFIYTGCDGNNNRFSTEKQCQQICVPDKKLCRLQKETGPCRAAKPRWYFEQASQTCKEFVYGGCKGNANNFENKNKCMRACGN